MEWIQKKFAPAPKKSSVPAVRHQETAEAKHFQDDVFAEAAPEEEEETTVSKRNKNDVRESPEERKKAPAREVRLSTLHTFRKCR